MSSFQPTPTPGTAPELPITNDGWFPDVDLVAMRKACRLDGTVTPERLRSAAVTAVLHVNDQLAAWKQAQLDIGLASLADVPSPQIDGSTRAQLLYTRALIGQVQSQLIEQYRDYDTTAKGDKRADAMDPRIDDARRDLRWALSDLQGLPRCTVELI